ncbi:MAG: beta-ketoacyl synthase N-terminal-like domain-containing protein [Polyangiaceae bacterium]
MTRAAVIAIGAISPLGRAVDAYDVTASEPRVAIARDDALAEAGFLRPFTALVPRASLAPAGDARDRATELLDAALLDAIARADEALPEWRSRRLGVALGTSSGGMQSAERFFDARASGAPTFPEDAARATYFGPLEALRRRGLEIALLTQLVTACAASTWAIRVGLLWLRRRAVDVVLAGGYDAHTRFVHAGFDAIRATSASRPAPFRVRRDGMALGEGAGIVVLVREEDAPLLDGAGRRPAFFVSGFGASTDAVHVTAPDRTGTGLARAATAAIVDAGVRSEACVAVSAHATATPFNDAMEARALGLALGEVGPVVHAFKAQIGHTLGAAGVLEALAIGHALDAGVLPATPGEGPLDDDARVRLLSAASRSEREDRFALKVSAAFGGVNAALVLEPSASARRASSDAAPLPVGLAGYRTITAPDAATVARVTGLDRDAILRADALSLLGLTAVAALVEGLGVDVASLTDAALVVGHVLATVDINERFHARIRERGPAAAEPRVFPPTSPNLVAGQIAIHFRVRGPSAAVCRGLDGGVEALEIAWELVAAGHAPRAIVVAVDHLGLAATALAARAFPTERLEAGATAALLDTSSARRLELDRTRPSASGHAGLAELLATVA